MTGRKEVEELVGLMADLVTVKINLTTHLLSLVYWLH